MDVSEHTLETLFQQLGLPNEQVEIEAFVEAHKPLPLSVSLAEADFWNDGQAAFIAEAFADDAEWIEAVDQLDALLRD
ncbi:DUF2789 family protein [Hydrogenovibrio sp. JE_KL2]|uniref:DUF2789 family protein n=1 Tax=Hydrogenovibrio sp. JE_KL2 TaxID=2651188 RepID=UPI00128C2AE2|nr:DUF2789 family protein [Hydrogenovibrio sp. JE_KL2]MBD3820972.1 DUF2789 domain-containing protein [Thiotrichales bacterium]MPQ76625.1 DUF2789 domain-containing protein [Hydrogenovibrio sp. JE_KL2]